jgi:hypothetical protein
LTHHLQTVYRLLNRLSWIPIHQVAMHHDPASVKLRVTLATCSTVTPLSINFNKRSEATSRPPETAIQPEAFSNKHKSLENFFRSEY